MLNVLVALVHFILVVCRGKSKVRLGHLNNLDVVWEDFVGIVTHVQPSGELVDVLVPSKLICMALRNP
jgi:hypothetical protein